MLLEIILAKIIIKTLNLLGSRASSLPGKILYRIDKSILRKLVKGHFEKIILITGTNGKTTTTKIIANYYKDLNQDIIFNDGGSNIIQGIISTLVNNISINGSYQGSTLILEIDEATLAQTIDDINPTEVVILNLMRDQLDRFAEVDILAQKIFNSIDNLSQKPSIIYNGDDPILEKYFGSFDDIQSFGIAKNIDIFYHSDRTSEQILSPIDNLPIVYSKRFFSNLGHYIDQSKKFMRSNLDVELVNYSPKLIKVMAKGVESSLTLDKESKNYNIYNYLAAITLLSFLNVFDSKLLGKVINGLNTFGREEIIYINNHKTTLYLIKNPNGANQLMYSLLKDNIENIIISLSDNLADGRDISWIWDTDFSLLRNINIFTTGSRKEELSMCLYYQGIDSSNITDVGDLLKKSGQEDYAIISTYTGMLKIRKALVGSKIS
jgi:UDP-N-acetylmuramoyl-L-alanyl-D-glutamate--2,6-diaminopimelate ligase